MDPKTMTGEEIVISGIAGKFPKANNVKEYQENLLNGIDCISEKHNRWNTDHPSVPRKTGRIEGVTKCDSTFFSIHTRAAHQMEPMMRMMLECAYEAIIDAGIDPRTLKGSKTGVFMSSSWSDCEKIVMYGRLKSEHSGLVIAGVSRSMFANRVSFFLGLTGPSYNIDTGCTASFTALEQAFSAIKEGVCENAIVGSAYLALHPHMAIQLTHLGFIAPDGQTKSFDANANGYTFSEAISVLFLQKSEDAKRIYAEVVNVQSEHGPSVPTNSVLFPKSDFQAQLMKQTLNKSNLSGKDISYIEADGLGIKDADAREAEAIDLVYNEGRDSPLLIGSVKSNIGHASSTNGFNSIIKVLIAMQTGIIPKNLHYQTPSELIPALSEGRLQVVTKPTIWEGTYAAVNSTSFTGNAAHVILKAYKKKKNEEKLMCDLPRIITISGRTKEAVEVILDDLERRLVDVEMIQLLSDIFENDTHAHLYRGYTLLPPQGLPQKKQREIQHCPTRHMEVWFVFSGMGSQWIGMGESLLRLPVFAEAVRKCDAVLKPRGFDIYKILTNKDPSMFENIIHSFVGIATVQIGLVDVLASIGIKPDFMIGHSVGELGCAYADGCFTAEEMVISALCRGLASVESPLIQGSMAAVGLSYEEVKHLVPSDIDVACHNSSTSSTISGPADSMKKFVKELQDKGIFAREVACSNIAYHSRYIAPAGPKLLAYLHEAIPEPKPRTTRWVSSSVPRRDWSSAKCRLSSAEYHTNNLLNPVLFAESSQAIPENAIAIEIAPHGLLQAILKKSLPKSCINIPLTKRGHENNIEFFLTALGKIYNAGLQPEVKNFYPRIEYPVGRGTPSISSLLRWDHSLDLFTDFYNPIEKVASGEKQFEIDLSKDEWKFLNGNQIYGKVFIPISLYLNLVWDLIQTLNQKSAAVIFENVKIHEQQVALPTKGAKTLTVMVQKGSGTFEVTCDNRLLATGNSRTDELLEERINIPEVSYNHAEELSKDDVYTEFNMRGFQYSDSFLSIQNCSMKRDRGTVTWGGNLTILLNGMIQLYTLGSEIRKIQSPLTIRQIIIDVKQLMSAANYSQEISISVNREFNIISSKEVNIIGITLTTLVPEMYDNEGFSFTPELAHLQNVSNSEATQLHSGNLESIAWTEGPPTNELEFEKLAKVEHAAIDHQDLKPTIEVSLTDVIERSKFKLKKFGRAFSGINSEGNRIMGISESGTLATYASIHPEYTWMIPESWTFEDAATVPLSYAVAYGALCLYETMNWYSLINNKAVLILDGCSSYSQAAINIAQHNKWKTFPTYVTEAERQFIRSQYPQISESNILCAEKVAFRDHLLLETKGAGVDIVFCNNCNLKLIETYLSCIKRGGHFVFVGELEGAVYESLGMSIFWKEIVISSFIPKKILSAGLGVRRRLSSMIKEGLSCGAIVPLYHTTYPRDMLKTAFADVLSDKNLGSTVIKIQSHESNQALAVLRFYASECKAYLIIEGISTFGFELIDFLVARGARNIVVTSVSRNKENYYKLRLNFWHNCGVTVMIRENMDLSKKANFVKLLKETTVMGPIDTIFDLQRVTNQTGIIQDTLKTMNLYTQILDEESRQACPHLDNFIICSRYESYEGKKETELERLCRQRVENGFPAILVLWEIKSSLFQKNGRKSKDVVRPTVSECIEQLDRIIGQNTHVIRIAFESTFKELDANQSRKAVAEESEEKKFYNYVFHKDGTKDYSITPIHLLS